MTTTYLMQGAFAMPQSRMVAFRDEPLSPQDMAVEIIFGIWELPDADNDETMDDGPEAA